MDDKNSASTRIITRSNSTSEPEKSNKSSAESSSLKTPNDKIDSICMMLKQLTATVDSNQKSSIERFRSLENKLSLQTEAWKSEINNTLAKHLLDTENKYKTLAVKVSSVNAMVDDKFEEVDRQNRLCEILLRGIPMNEKENLTLLFEKMSTVLKFQHEKMYALHSIFRFRSKIHTNDEQLRAPPILIKFSTPIIKREFFNLFLKQKDLNLSHLGFNSSNRIYISDNLTKKNSNILKKAAEMKTSKKIEKVQVRNGFIHIMYPNAGKLVKINCLNDLLSGGQSTSQQSSPLSIDLNKTIQNE